MNGAIYGPLIMVLKWEATTHLLYMFGPASTISEFS